MAKEATGGRAARTASIWEATAFLTKEDGAKLMEEEEATEEEEGEAKTSADDAALVVVDVDADAGVVASAGTDLAGEAMATVLLATTAAEATSVEEAMCDNGDDYGGGYGAEIPRPGYGGRGMSSGYDSRRRPPMRDSGPYMADLAPIDFSRVELPPFQKDFYTEHKNVTSRSDSEIEEWRKFKKITVVGKAPRPAHNWVEAMLPDFVLEYIKKKGFLEPTAIQSQGFPMALSGNDLVAISETGSGKTLTYAAPGILHVQAQPPTDAASGPIALVMAPTRELAMQIRAEFRAIGEGSPVTSACAYGGASKMRQLADIANGVDILVATPGRLLEYLAEGSVTLKRVTYLVVDEADRMIHEGFEEELRQIFSCVRPDRQVLMFSATWPEEVRDLAQEFLKDAARVHIGKDEIVAAKNIKQEVVICHGYMDKRDKLVQILEDVKAQRGKIIVFLNTKRSVQEMTDWLRDKPNNYEALCLHGDKRQEERDFALNEFRKGGHPILLATDVAQRGLDIPDVTTVCNFDVPDNVASYVHRIGRTARAGREGRSFTLVSGSRDRAMAAEIVQVMQRDEQIIPEELEEYAREDALFAPIETSTPFTDTLAASTSNEAAPAAWGSASSASTSSRGVPAAKSDEASTGAGWGPSDVKGDEASGPSSEQTPKPWGKTANEVQKDEDSSAAGYDSGYGGSSPETSPAKSTTWGRSSSLLSPTELDHNVVESHTLETADEEVRPEDFLAKMVAPGDADSDGGSGTITPTEAAKLEADLDKVSLDDDA
ncbi:ATP-dependent RNA helicase dbp2 [Rhodotorula toruloides]|uniref:RNA helicase n=1 Tax=Rhodotorula toruloides TaxID=5286 RepID=A0A511KFY9_RHOTO|nr:ATP-dependent RNA helicase dbp2 [Rhodotorula toruloides]